MDEAQVHRSYEIALRNMSQEGWQGMLNSEKLQDLQAVENETALREGREACILSGENLGEGNGFWGYQQGSKIAINKQELSSEANKTNFKEHMDTVLHEGRHSFQDQAANNPRLNATKEQIKAWNSEIPDPSINPKGYYNHPAEADARAFAKDRYTQMAKERQIVKNYDASHRQNINQILVTYDYTVLNHNNVRTPDGKEGIKTGNKAQDIKGKEASFSVAISGNQGSNGGKGILSGGQGVKGATAAQGASAAQGSGAKGGAGGKGAGAGIGGIGGASSGARLGAGIGGSAGAGSGAGQGPGGSSGPGAGPGTGPGIGGDGGPGIGA